MTDLILNDKKKVISCMENVHRMLRDQKRWRFRFNELGGVVQVTENRSGPENLTQARITAITRWCETKGLFIASSKVGEVVAELSLENRAHPVRDYLTGLKWDGTKRLEKWLITYFGAEDSTYIKAVGKCWLISAVARAMKPGCQVDHVLLFQGPQGILKSSAIRALAGDDSWFIDDLGDIRGKDALMQIGGAWLVECGSSMRSRAPTFPD
jgi:predicted P-loop ATPase